MGAVVAQASMSLDGYIAKADNSIGKLFDWYMAGSRLNARSGDQRVLRVCFCPNIL